MENRCVLSRLKMDPYNFVKCGILLCAVLHFQEGFLVLGWQCIAYFHARPQPLSWHVREHLGDLHWALEQKEELISFVHLNKEWEGKKESLEGDVFWKLKENDDVWSAPGSTALQEEAWLASHIYSRSHQIFLAINLSVCFWNDNFFMFLKQKNPQPYLLDLKFLHISSYHKISNTGKFNT